eukprot:TRINITY_DN2939_c0_g1_i1.p1 TRINITY_DN2939_c0_g1~~TRINITY_DN2939_c0_g1_i1.p1  ORF type:complete len:215 (+),score=39.34 TRINITY_DN2939_c0_g1_i1:147-791(+)
MPEIIDGANHPTSVMIRNIPTRATAEAVLRKVDSLGFEGDYDFFYLPCFNNTGKTTNINHNYAFINFKEWTRCEDFMQILNCASVTLRRGSKVLSACYARVQGLDSLLSCTKQCKGKSMAWTEDHEVSPRACFHRLTQSSGTPDILTTKPVGRTTTGVDLALKAQAAGTETCVPRSFEEDASRCKFSGSPEVPMYIAINHEYYADVAAPLMYSL